MAVKKKKSASPVVPKKTEYSEYLKTGEQRRVKDLTSPKNANNNEWQNRPGENASWRLKNAPKIKQTSNNVIKALKAVAGASSAATKGTAAKSTGNAKTKLAAKGATKSTTNVASKSTGKATTKTGASSATKKNSNWQPIKDRVEPKTAAKKTNTKTKNKVKLADERKFY